MGDSMRCYSGARRRISDFLVSCKVNPDLVAGAPSSNALLDAAPKIGQANMLGLLRRREFIFAAAVCGVVYLWRKLFSSRLVDFRLCAIVFGEGRSKGDNPVITQG